jgi:cyanophycinase
MSGAVVHVLPAGSVFDLSSRTLVEQAITVPDSEIAEVRAAEADLRNLARDIAAEGVSSSHYARRLRRGSRSS